MFLKAALGVWAAIALLTASADHEKSFLGETIDERRTGLGLLISALVLVTIFVVFQLLRLRPWARTAAVVLECLAIVLALSRLPNAVGPSLVATVLSVAVITLVVTAGRIKSG